MSKPLATGYLSVFSHDDANGNIVFVAEGPDGPTFKSMVSLHRAILIRDSLDLAIKTAAGSMFLHKRDKS